MIFLGHHSPRIVSPQMERAFSLVEVAAALGILSFSLCAILGLIPIALQTTRHVVNASVHTRMLQATRTELLNMPFSTLPPVATFTFSTDGIACPSGDKRYEVTATISGSSTIPGGTLKSLSRVQISSSNVITHEALTSQFYLPDNGF